MSSEQETKSTEETQIGGNLDAAGSASGAANIGANASSKKSEERRKPKKLGQKSQANGEKADGEGDADGPEESPTPQPKMDPQTSASASARSGSRRGSRGRGRDSSEPPSEVDSAYRSDVSQKGGRRNRNRNRGKAQAQTQQQGKGGLLGGGGGPLDAVDEVGDTVNGVVDGAGNLVNDTVGKTLSKPHEALGGLLHSKGGKEGEGEEGDGETNEQLRLRLDLNLDIEVQLKAKIHGDLTLGLLSVNHPFHCANANVSQELVHDLDWTPPSTSPSKYLYKHSLYNELADNSRAAIAVIRMSGPACLHIYQQLCPNRGLPRPRTAALRKLYDPETARSSDPRVLDTGSLVLYFPAPNTVTGEDVLEFHVHGGPAIVRSVLAAIARCGHLMHGREGTVRHAEPGEFTKWAFYNGRLDLTQAEALGESLAAETEQQRRLAVSGADGGLAKRYEEWRTMLLYARGELEALIDFSEDQHFDESPVEFVASISTQVQALKRKIELHLQNASKGELLRNGINVAFLGAPNAGKSSLLNQIVGREAAIVSAEEGTTRDIVDVSIDLNGWLCRLGDMAGLRATGTVGEQQQQQLVGAVELEGIRRARERALQSDVVLVLLPVEMDKDGNPQVPVNGEVLEAVQQCDAAGKIILVVLNKIDLLGMHDDPKQEGMIALQTRIHQIFPTVPERRICLVSCKDATTNVVGSDPGGIQAFLKQLTSSFMELTAPSAGEDIAEVQLTAAEAQFYWTTSLSVTHRQTTYLSQCLHHLEDFLAQSQSRPQSHLHMDTPEFSDSRASATDYRTDRHNDLVAPNIAQVDGDGDTDGAVDIVTAAEHLRFAADCLAKITGKGGSGDVEDILGVVFEK
ncbi:tRNA modification GTPase TrmE [Fonsecaea nubica]|uniref:tRNA modification GTPase TrmE n=1 Tax=Fonsecaea nubica TaxID=856822 RepID=A0A178DH10_9EURO|nr:tRNA modification GTPase TrmE [Fonsecaea nubica]OAL40604.1 tRNA modification GTPase TrmE [Fonsecaea nubica]